MGNQSANLKLSPRGSGQLAGMTSATHRNRGSDQRKRNWVGEQFASKSLADSSKKSQPSFRRSSGAASRSCKMVSRTVFAISPISSSLRPVASRFDQSGTRLIQYASSRRQLGKAM